jgi:exosome complex component RRP4
VIVGRIKEKASKKWKVDIKAHQDALLLLSSINLPGGVQRRKTENDELEMDTYFVEGEMISAEVQQFFNDGAACINYITKALHTRSNKYRKLRNGCLVQVPCNLIKRSKSHFVSLACNVDIILGMNGCVWVSKHITVLPDANEFEDLYSPLNGQISREDRICIARVCNVITALSRTNTMIFESSIVFAYEQSLEFSMDEIVKDEVIAVIVEKTLFLLNQ